MALGPGIQRVLRSPSNIDSSLVVSAPTDLTQRNPATTKTAAAHCLVQSRPTAQFSFAEICAFDPESSSASLNFNPPSTVIILPPKHASNSRATTELRGILVEEAVLVERENKTVWRLPLDSVTVLDTLSQLGFVASQCCVDKDGVFTWTMHGQKQQPQQQLHHLQQHAYWDTAEDVGGPAVNGDAGETATNSSKSGQNRAYAIRNPHDEDSRDHLKYPDEADFTLEQHSPSVAVVGPTQKIFSHHVSPNLTLLTSFRVSRKQQPLRSHLNSSTTTQQGPKLASLSVPDPTTQQQRGSDEQQSEEMREVKYDPNVIVLPPMTTDEQGYDAGYGSNSQPNHSDEPEQQLNYAGNLSSYKLPQTPVQTKIHSDLRDAEQKLRACAAAIQKSSSSKRNMKSLLQQHEQLTEFIGSLYKRLERLQANQISVKRFRLKQTGGKLHRRGRKPITTVVPESPGRHSHENGTICSSGGDTVRIGTTQLQRGRNGVISSTPIDLNNNSNHSQKNSAS